MTESGLVDSDRVPGNGEGRILIREGRLRRTVRGLRLLGAYFVQFAKSRMAYRADFFVDLATNLLGILSSIAFLWLLFRGDRITALNGWSREQCFFIYAFSMVSIGIFHIVGVNFFRFASYFIMEGRFDQVLVRPVPPLIQILCERFRMSALVEIALGVGLMVWAGRRIGVDAGIGNVTGLAFLAICGGVLLIAIFLMATSVSFWFEDRMGIGAPVFNLIQFGRYPMDIYSGLLQILLRWVIPFGFIAFYPSVGIIGGDRLTPELRLLFLLTPVVTLGFALLAGAVFHAGIRRYESTGS